MWKNFDPTIYTRDQYQQHIESLPHLPWVKFIVLHNTGNPSLSQWVDGGVSEEQRLINLEYYYDHTMAWHAGPHAFISPTHICGFSDPTKPGVQCSCFNSVSLGFEMVGDFSTDSFDSGPGAMVRDNAVFMLAVWHRKLGLRPDKYRYGVSGLAFHKDCIRDHHDCPGKNVDRTDMVDRVLAQMSSLSGVPMPVQLTPLPPTNPPTKSPLPISAYLRIGSKGIDVSSIQAILGIMQDGIFGVKTEAAVETFQSSHGLIPDGIIGILTLAALQAEKSS